MSINNKLFKEMFKKSSAAAQHKAACRETRLDIQNYVCNGNLLCYHGVVEKNTIPLCRANIIIIVIIKPL